MDDEFSDRGVATDLPAILELAMKTLIGYAIVLTSCLCAGQTSQEFHSRYGDSDTERFKIRDGIGLTVEYGSDGLACQMEIKPQNLFVQRNRRGSWHLMWSMESLMKSFRQTLGDEESIT